MKRFMSITLSILFICCSTVFSQNIIGNWKGNLEINGQTIPIVFHFFKDSTGKLNGKWDSPTQNAMNLPCSDVTVKGDSVIVGLKIISGFYEGKFLRDDSIAGIWHQGQGQLILNVLKTGTETFKLPSRPQSPKPPFNYDVEDTIYFNADHSMQYGATFTKPFSSSRNKKFPAVLLITGSGKQDRDENIFDHKPFAVIADYLTKRGIAVLRVDDRGMGKTTGNFDTSSSEDFAKDVEAGINYLKSRDDVDTKHIGLIGHSEGGMIAPMVAAHDKDVTFIVMLAGTGVPGIVINDYQNTLPLKNAGISDSSIQNFLELHHELIHASTSAATPEDYKNDVSKIYFEWKKNQSPETINELIKGTDEQVISTLQNKYSLFHSKWWKFFLVHDPASDLEKLSIPVLALNGEKDIQ
ncbi:MAG: alpha/beta hydrolase, partial [Ginsengibacter sp.]